MRDSVSKAFKSFSTKFEGYLTFMYGDVKNLVTTGMGNLIDPIGQALSLPWVNTDGSAATQQQITDAWNAVKARTDLNQKGGASYKSVTTIRLTDAGIDQLIQSRLQSNESTLRSRYPGYDNWPADAQLGIHSMAWAMGPAFNFPKFKADVNKDPPDFTTAATDCQMSATGNPGLVPRNTANNKLFLNAAAVLTNKADPDQLYYPGDVPATAPTTTTHPPTTTTHHPASTTTHHPPTTTTHHPATTTAAPAKTTTATPAKTTTAAPAKTTTVAPAKTTTATPAKTTTAAPAKTTTAPAKTTTAPAQTTTAAPSHTTTAAPAASTTAAPAQTTTAAPAATTTAAPATSTTAAPGTTTTAAPGSTTTAAIDSSGGGSGAGSGAGSGDASGAAPTVEGSIELDPDDGTQQNPNSLQVAKSVKLKIKWSSTNADSVDIDSVGSGLAASGEQDIPTQDANYALVASGKTGKSEPFNIEVHTHDDGAVVSPHVDLGSGIMAVISFIATKNNLPITSAKIGDTITLTAIFSDATQTAKINGKDADLTEMNDGQKQASLDVSIDASSDGNFDAQAVGDGTGAASSQHIDVVPADATGAGSGDATGAGTHADAGTGTHDATGAGTHDGTADHTGDATGAGTHDGTGDHTGDATGAGTHDGTGDHTGAGTHDGTGDHTGAGTHDGTGDHTGAGTADAELINPEWSAVDGSGGGSGAGTGELGYTHGETIQLNVDASGEAEGRTVYFEIEHSEDGTTWTKVKEVTSTIQKGKASVTTELPDPDGSGAGSGGSGAGSGASGGGSGAFDYCHYRFHASFTAGDGTGGGGSGS